MNLDLPRFREHLEKMLQLGNYGGNFPILRSMDRPRTPLEALKTIFGYDSFRGDQQAIIDHLIGGGDALVIMPTGAGKSLCFQIPSILRDGIGIVISPLIALMRDQVEALRQAGVRAAALNSSLLPAEADAVRRAARRGELDLLYVAPERLLHPDFQSFLGEIRIAMFAIDEAHCVSQWGHDFRPEYLQLAALHERFPDAPRIAVTATADEPTRREIAEKLGLRDAPMFLGGFDRPNIQYQVTLKNNPRAQLLAFLKARPKRDSGIIYCLSRKKTEETAAALTEQGYTALPYHAGLDSSIRDRHQDRFLNEDGVIVVATIAFGMGIDKPDVRFVCHLDLPKTIEAYYQETGRAGRDGEPAVAWMLYGMGDLMTVKHLIERGEANETHKRLEHRKLNSLLGYCETARCRRQVLLAYFGEVREQRCGNCDTCLFPVESWDGTVAAQKALSCIARTGQRFGAQYLIQVLRGAKEDPRIGRFGHDRLPTFGVGADIPAPEWHSIFRQLIAAGYITSDLEGYGSLLLGGESRAVLKGEQRVLLRKDPVIKREKSAKASKKPVFQGEADQALFDALRVRRRALAEAQRVPPYVIFHDRTLQELAARKPRSLAEMIEVSGIGESKRDRYGAEFLEIILSHLAESPATATGGAR